MSETRPLSFSMKDDFKTCLAFLAWIDPQADTSLVRQFVEEREAKRAAGPQTPAMTPTVSIPSMWDDSPQPESTITTTHKEGDPLLIVKARKPL